MTVTRPLTPDDAPAIARLLHANRKFMAPYEPIRGDTYYTVERQREVLGELLERARRQEAVPLVIVDDDGELVGRITINTIVRGAFQSGTLGYWVSEHANGRGLARRAVAEVKWLAFTEMELHRLDAATLLDNVRSQRVLAHNGFERFGVAPHYLKIAGAWRDHVLFQALNEP